LASWENNKKISFCGTAEYMSPEMLLRRKQGRALDYWALGAFL